jgi:hypothetical protein
MPNATKNDVWVHICNELDITINLDKPNIMCITATQIQKCKETWEGPGSSQFEPRLLCKMDSSDSRPNIFKKYGMYMISVDNGTYAIIKHNIYI